MNICPISSERVSKSKEGRVRLGVWERSMECEFLIFLREAWSPIQTERSDNRPKGCVVLAQKRSKQAREVKWKRIQVNFLEELTLFETS